MDQPKSHTPSPALIISMVALLVAMSGTAVAVSRNSVGPKELKREAVGSRHVQKNAIRSKELKRNSVKSGHVKNEKLKSKDLKDGQGVSGDDVIDGSIGRDDLGPSSVAGANVAADSLTGADIDEGTLEVAGQQGPPGPEGEQGAQGPPGPATGGAGGDLTGSYPDPEIAIGAVGTAKLDDLAVTAAKVAENAIGSARVADDALTGDDIDESQLGKVPDADELDGLDSSQFVQGSGRETNGIAFSLAEGASTVDQQEDGAGRLRLGCTNAEGVTIEYTNLQTGIFSQDVWIDPGDLGSPSFDQVAPSGTKALTSGADAVAHVRIHVIGAGVAHTYDLFARHTNGLNGCRYGLSRKIG